MGAVVSLFGRLFGGTPDPRNTTNDKILRHHEMERQAREAKGKAGADLVDIKRRAKMLKEEPPKKQSEARERKADAQKSQEAKLAAEQALHDVELAEQRCEDLETREKETMDKEAEAKRITEELKQAMLNVEECQEQTKTGALTEEQEAEAWMAADARLEQARRYLELMTFCREGHEGNIQPEVWPTEEEFQLAQRRIQYDPEKIHFAVCGGSGSGKSSLVNAFRGLKNNSPDAARTGVVETTRNITRYPDPQQEMPYKRLVWFDCPGAGTLKVPGWQYFNTQGLFIFDVIVLVYDTRFTEIDLSIIQNCGRFKIPLFIVRSKADTHIRNIMKDLGYDENDDDAEENYEEYQEQARRLLIDTTKHDLKENLEEAGLAMHDIFIISSSVIYSLVTMKPNKKTSPPLIDEARLVVSVLKAAYERRYSTQAPSQNSRPISTRDKDKTTTGRFKKNKIMSRSSSFTDWVISHQSSEAENMAVGP